MKKNIFLSILVGALFFAPVMSFAAQTDDKNTTNRTLATLEPQKSPAAEDLEKANPDSFKEDDFFVNENKSAPVATVSSTGETQNETHVVKAKAGKVETPAPKTSVETLSEGKTVEKEAKKELSPALNSTEMQKRWKALFSKEAATDSIIYTVKSGDSLYVLARKNHTTVDFIKKINGLTSGNIYSGRQLKIHKAPFSIMVDKSENTLILYSDGEAVKKYSVATGKKNCTPIGEFKIKDKLVNPTWFKTGAILPPGSPENALGTRWMGFDKPAYGIHGTIEPKSIGTQASEGCIRMLNEDVEEIYSIVPVGTKVTIQD